MSEIIPNFPHDWRKQAALRLCSWANRTAI